MAMFKTMERNKGQEEDTFVTHVLDESAAFSGTTYTTCGFNKHSWSIGSGDRSHMCSDATLFKNQHTLPRSFTNSLPNGESTTITNNGTVVVLDGLMLQDVLFVLDFKCNISIIWKTC